MPSLKKYRIVIGENATFNEKRAADDLSRAIRLVLGVKLECVTDASEPYDHEIVLGKTTRETIDGLEFINEPDRNFDYVIRYVGTRLYMRGFGVDKYFCAPYKTYNKMDDGAIGTALAVFRFSQEVLGYDMAFSVHDSYPVLDDVEIDERCNFDYTREYILSKMPEKIEGAAWYSLPSPSLAQQGCSIFKSSEGRLVVIDGGCGANTEYLLRCLEYLSDGKKPVVHTWLFSHLHGDHYGAICNILKCEHLRERLEIENMYIGLPPLEYFTEWSPECSARYEEPYKLMENVGELMGTKLHRHVEGEHIIVDDLDFHVIRLPKITGPAPEGGKLMNINDTSVLFRLTVGAQKILLLGDAERHCDEELLRDYAEYLPCDVLQVPHHGNGNVSYKCYEAMQAKLYVFQTCEMHWYSEGYEGYNSRNIGMVRTMYFIKRLGVDTSKLISDSKGILSFELPIKNI